MRGGVFITIEGGEGAGKSTLISKLSEKIFQETKRSTLITREPGGVPIAESIRNVILDTKNTEMDGRTEALLYAAARRQHLVEVVMPGIDEGKIIVCDRFVDSSLAYQGYARGLGIDKVWEINRFATKDCMPHLTLYLDIDPEVGLSRIEANSHREVNRLDLESLAFHKKVREGYLEIVRRFPDRIRTLDASGSSEEIVDQAWEHVKKALDAQG
ncbi:dTMP kinase [Cohnella terricola]|uniref:Thymidylate kinase n=1 Tax=Cohnella terricola TaxID=1289167 RepID=A0A559J7D3_9BACL|nr:dTMP kinase [Cohnella terricola]TVX95767.1 dTMP kinase [Cohnella terricola]